MQKVGIYQGAHVFYCTRDEYREIYLNGEEEESYYVIVDDDNVMVKGNKAFAIVVDGIVEGFEICVYDYLGLRNDELGYIYDEKGELVSTERTELDRNGEVLTSFTLGSIHFLGE